MFEKSQKKAFNVMHWFINSTSLRNFISAFISKNKSQHKYWNLIPHQNGKRYAKGRFYRRTLLFWTLPISSSVYPCCGALLVAWEKARATLHVSSLGKRVPTQNSVQWLSNYKYSVMPCWLLLLPLSVGWGERTVIEYNYFAIQSVIVV